MADDVIQGWQPTPGALCAKCGTNPAGPGGILCPGCAAAIGARLRGVAGREQPQARGGTVEQSARESD
jgi:hypothetical protein